MKKILPLIAIVAFTLFTINQTNAQVERMPLFEEFTNASCPPCATQNPHYNGLIDANLDEIVSIKWQTNFPGFDPFYADVASIVDARRAYYGITGVPTAAIDGELPTFTNGSYDGAPGAFTQQLFDDALAEESPISIVVSHEYDVETVDYTIVITNESNEEIPSDMRLFVGIMEEVVEFDNPPGSTDERIFYQVVRDIYTPLDGMKLDAIPPGESITITNVEDVIDGIYDLNGLGVFAFVQNYDTKYVLNSGKSAAIESGFPDLGLSLRGISDDESDIAPCENENSTLEIVNKESVPVESFVVEYATFNGETQIASYDGDVINEGESVDIEIEPSPLPGVYDRIEIVSINGETNDLNKDDNGGNDFSFYKFLTLDDRILANFEKASENDNSIFKAVHLEQPALKSDVFSIAETGAYDESSNSLRVNLQNWTSDKYNIGSDIIMRKAATGVNQADSVFLSFDVAMARDGGSQDAMTVYYSTDCGENWQRIKRLTAPELSTSPSRPFAFFPRNDEWNTFRYYLSDASENETVYIKFRIVSDNGNGLFLDNVELDAQGVLSSDDYNSFKGEVAVLPNPTTNGNAVINLEISKPLNTSIEVFNSNGQLIKNPLTNAPLTSGSHSFDIRDLSSGVYYVKVSSGAEFTTQKLIVQ